MIINCEGVTEPGVEAADEMTGKVEDVTGDGVEDELDCPWIDVDAGVELAVDVNGEELERGVSEGKVKGVEVAVEDMVTGTETITCQYKPYYRWRKHILVELEAIFRNISQQDLIWL